MQGCTYFLRFAGLAIPLIGIFLVTSEQPVWCFVFLVIYGVQLRFLGWAGYGHELYHEKVFTSKRFNRVLFVLFSAINYKNFGFFDVFHPIHHVNTLQTGNDLEGYASKHPKPKSFIQRFAGCTFNLPRLLTDVKILILNACGSIHTEPGYLQTLSQTQINKIIFGARLTLILNVSLLITAIMTFGVALGICVVYSHYIFTQLNDNLSAMQHSDGIWDANDFKLNTNTVRVSAISRFLYANMNYHREHHMYPSIPYYNLAKLHDELVSQHPELTIDN